MGGYIPGTAVQQREMLAALGLRAMDELFADVPASLRVKELNLPAGKSELEVRRAVGREITIGPASDGG